MSSAKRLAREILDTRRLALGHATSPQLTSSALDGGQLDITDGEGNRVGGLGVDYDGGFVIDYTGGPKPPKPSPPTVTADAGIFRVEWDGSFVNEGDEGVLATSDTDRVEIHASMDENFVPDRVQSFGGAFATLDGGSFTLGPLPEAGTYYFRLVARSKSAQFSEPSDRVEQELAITSIDLEITDAWLTGEAAQTTADGKNSIWRGPDEPEADPDRPFKDGDIWFEMVDGKSIPNIWDETAGAWVANDDYRQSEIERVQQELREELDTIVVDGSGTKNFYTPDMPTEGMREGDLWFDSSDSNKPYIYQDGEWITVRDSFSKAGAAERFASVRDKHSLDNWWSNVPGFALDSSVKPTVPSGASGDATIKIALQGSFDPAGSWVLDETGVSPNGLPIGIESQIYVKSSGGSPTGNFVFGLQMPGGNPASAPVPLDVVSGGGPFAGATHQLSVSATAKSYAEMYGPIVERMWFSIEITLPAAAAGDFIAFETLSASYLVPSTGIADKAITTEKIATGAITAESGIIGSIDAGTITVGTIDAARIGANTITADKLLVGTGGNVVPWGQITAGATYAPHEPYGGATASLVPADESAGLPAHLSVTRTSTGSWASVLSLWSTPGHKMAVDEGKEYVMTIRVYSSDVSQVRLSLFGYAHGGPSTGSPSGAIGTATGVQVGPNVVEVTTRGVVPAGVGYCLPYVQTNGPGTIGITNADMRRSIGATLIEGGAISTEHIRAGAITAESGIIGSLDANVITVGKIMGNQLDADAINGKTITGATIRTASSGSRVELTHNGLKQYNALGQTVTDMSLGRLSLVGDIATGFAGERRVEIKQDLWPNGSGIVFASQGETVTGDLSREALVGSPSPGSIVLAAQAVPGTVRHSIEADPRGMHLSAYETNASGEISGRMAQLGFSQAAADPAQRGTHWGAGTSNGVTDSFQPFIAMAAADSENHWAGIPPKHIRISAPVVHMSSISNDAASSNALFSIESNAGVSFSGAGSNSLRFKTNDGGYSASIGITGFSPTLSLTASGGIFPSANSGSGTNLVLTSDGRMARASSSRRYKTDIKPFQHETGVLDLELVTFRYQEDGATGMASDGPLLGVIAEDVAAAGVDCLVIPDSEGRPDGVFYDKIGLLLVPIVREQRDRIESLEARIAALEAA